MEYLTEWFAQQIESHSAVTSVTQQPSGHVQLTREGLESVVVAPVSTELLEAHDVDRILAADGETIICLIPTASHYTWEARERAVALGSTVHTMGELYSALSADDPRLFLNKNVAYARDRLQQHSKVAAVRMVCEALMEVDRVADLNSIRVAVEYEYEFSEEALVKALKRHPDADAVLNANPNGTPTDAALGHAKVASVGLFLLADLMGALNYDGDAFFHYQPPDRGRK